MARARYNPRQVRRQVLDTILDQAYQRVRVYMRSQDVSKTLYEALSALFVRDTGGSAIGRLVLPFYWAEFVHNARGAIVRGPGETDIIFFPDKKDDPRTQGGLFYPQSPSRRVKLTPWQFEEYARENAIRRALGLDPVMVVTRRVGPVRRRKPFYDEPLAPAVFPGAVDERIVGTLLDANLKAILGPDQRRRASFRLG